MYITGNISNFASRLHQLPTGIADLNDSNFVEGSNISPHHSFLSEMLSYHAATGLLVSWTKEYDKKYTQITHHSNYPNFYISPKTIPAPDIPGYFQLNYPYHDPTTWVILKSSDGLSGWEFFQYTAGNGREFDGLETPFYYKVLGTDNDFRQSTLESDVILVGEL